MGDPEAIRFLNNPKQKSSCPILQSRKYDVFTSIPRHIAPAFQSADPVSKRASTRLLRHVFLLASKPLPPPQSGPASDPKDHRELHLHILPYACTSGFPALHTSQMVIVITDPSVHVHAPLSLRLPNLRSCRHDTRRHLR